MPEKYPLTSYDKYLCLKLNDTLWLILLFLLRPYVITVFSLSNRQDRTGIINIFYPDHIAMWWGLLVGAPAAFIIYAWLKKKPDAHPFIKVIWKKGRVLLAGSAILNALIVLTPLLTGPANQITVAGWTQFVISLGIVLVLGASRYIRDCFNDFPVENKEAG